ncbi:uncharacterized protein V1516DRAFT_41966 [Lipomyces oligophaga]|uniref:uncharacterized protein n=1 Tax=Lipomyces oligophaga TaxID=45792 RepID=UPI0034CDD9FA
MADNADVASLLAALTQRAQQQTQQTHSLPVQQQQQPVLPSQSQLLQNLSHPQAQFPLNQLQQLQSSNTANPLAQLVSEYPQIGLQTPQQSALLSNPNAAAALAAVAAAVAAAKPGAGAMSNFNLPQPKNTGYLDINTMLAADPRDSVSLGEYYGSKRSYENRDSVDRYSDRDYSKDRRSHRDRDRDRDRNLDYDDRGYDRGGHNRDRERDRRYRRSPTPPRLQEDERCRECSPQREASPGGTLTRSVIVKSAFVGLIIGRGGDTLKRIEHSSGARIQFITNGKEGPERVCNVSGRSSDIDNAVNQIISMINSATLDSRGRPIQPGR